MNAINNDSLCINGYTKLYKSKNTLRNKQGYLENIHFAVKENVSAEDVIKADMSMQNIYEKMKSSAENALKSDWIGSGLSKSNLVKSNLVKSNLPVQISKRNLEYEKILLEDKEKAASNKKETETKTNIVVQPDGSRVLVITVNMGSMETTMSLEISKPTNMLDDTKQNNDNSDTLVSETDVVLNKTSNIVNGEISDLS